MAKFQVIVGDWSGDGHEKTQTFLVVVDDRFTSEILAANYRKNVAELGVDPTTFAAEYEDRSIPADVAKILDSYGVVYNEYKGESFMEDDAMTRVGMFNIMMFLFGHGLEGFSWEQEFTNYPVLVGEYRSAIGPEAVGYGLFV